MIIKVVSLRAVEQKEFPNKFSGISGPLIHISLFNDQRLLFCCVLNKAISGLYSGK